MGDNSCGDNQMLFWARSESTLINSQPTSIESGIASEQQCQIDCGIDPVGEMLL